MAAEEFPVEVKRIEPILVAGIRMRGKYSDCGDGFRRLGKAVGRYINGKAMLLCLDDEYEEEDANFEVCMPIRKPRKEVQGIEIHELPAGRFITIKHRGPYPELGHAYSRLLEHARHVGLEIDRPCREIYLKGPGMFFRGNPAKYLTEIQFPLKD